MDRPETRFVWNGDVALAYQVVGGGPIDIVYLQGWVSNVELNWDHPTMSRFLRGLGRGRRLIVTDPRGSGCSERSSPDEIWPLELMMDDLISVLDATGSSRTAILATNECAFVAGMFAATYPERTLGLILFQAAANYLWSEETPWEWTEERFQQQEEEHLRAWGTREMARSEISEGVPSMADDSTYAEWWFRYNLLSEGKGHAVQSARKYMHTDIRPILPSIHVPTLVMARRASDDSGWFDSARYLADHIPGARLTEIPGRDDHLWIGEQASLMRTIDSFLDAVRDEETEFQRVLKTVMFTDIVSSTHHAAELGDRSWRDLLERHHAHVRALFDRYRGVEVDTAGDGFFAAFDGPARAIRCARAIVDDVRPLGLEVRAGLHTGECESIDGKVGGIAVNIGARVGGLAGASEVLVSQTVKDLVVGSGLTFEDAGEHELKGVPERWHLYRVTS
jgi:class 3 adenylate cyclase